MSQRLTGGALVFLGAAPLGFEALAVIGGYTTGADPISPAYGLLLVLLGGGVYADEIHFEEESGEKYEALIFLWAIVVFIMMIGSVFITLS